MKSFFIDSSLLAKPLVTIKGTEAHHIRNVLRLRPGDSLKLFDGAGFEYEAVIIAMAAKKLDVEIRRKVRAVKNHKVEVIVAQAFLKATKMDDLVRKLSELGVDRWIPFLSHRSIPRPDEKRLAVRIQRWKRIAIEAAKQCRRVDSTKIGPALSFEDVLAFSDSCDLKIVFWEDESSPLRRDIGLNRESQLKRIIIMLGPEGGFTESEIEKAENFGFVTAGLGPRILRAETATLAACTLVQYLFGDMGPGVKRMKSESKKS
jgi:16S rRNA (uracil1498-N3)-methyltransferase